MSCQVPTLRQVCSHVYEHCLSQALDIELQEAEDLQLEAHSTHMQTLDSLVQMQRERIDATMLEYDEDRKVNALQCIHTCK